MLAARRGIENEISVWNREKKIWQFMPMSRFQSIRQNLALKHFFGASITQEESWLILLQRKRRSRDGDSRSGGCR